MNAHSPQNKHAPKDRQRDKLARKQGQRDAYDRILIVSEGSKTEPNYFNEIRRFYRLHSANIQVCHSVSGTSPLQVVEYARDLFLWGDPHKKISARAFDRIYAVFDRDDHQSYFAALDLAKKLNGNHKNDEKRAVQFVSIASIPCFELWLLLHFEDIIAPLHRNEVLKRLKKHLPNYEKSNGGIFTLLYQRLQPALARAEKLAKLITTDNGVDAYTGIADLVDYLMKINPR